MRRGQDFGQVLDWYRHAAIGEGEARQQDRGHQVKHAHLHRLDLALDHGRHGEAQRQADQGEQQGHEQQQPERADKGHGEDDLGRRQHHQHLDQPHAEIGHDLADHHLDRAQRGGQQVFHRPLLDLAGHRHRGQRDHGHRQDDRQQPGHGVVAGDPFGVVALVQDQGDRRRALLALAERAAQFAGQGLADRLVHRCNGRAGAGRIGGIDRQQQLRPLAPHQRTGKVGRHGQHELRLALGDQPLAFAIAVGHLDQVEVAGAAKRAEDRARKG